MTKNLLEILNLGCDWKTSILYRYAACDASMAQVVDFDEPVGGNGLFSR